MHHARASVVLFLTLVPAIARAEPEGGEVSVSLPAWQSIQDELSERRAEKPPPASHAIVERALAVRFERGVVAGSVEVTVDGLDGRAPYEVPLVGAEASLREVTLDGARALAVRSESYYALLVEGAGRHRIRASFAQGREDTRFARSFALALPPAPITKVSLDLPERGLAVEIDRGVILAERATERGTHVEAALEASEALSVRWRQRPEHRAAASRELEAEMLTLASIREETVHLATELHVRVLSGETDRVEIRVPASIDVTNVAGDALLQWYASPGERGEKRVTALLRHIVEDELSLTVEGELPREEAAARLAFLEPAGAKLREGWVAVEGRDGFEVSVASASGAEAVGVREVPDRLAELSTKPLLFAYRYQDAPPDLGLAIARNASIDLTQTLIDDLQASTVVLEQGAEITKLRLFVRNNTRQHLAMRLPPGAELTHAFIDGVPFHPAIDRDAGRGERVLVPLRQSEKLSDTRPRHHVVKAGETLGQIALLYYGRTDRGSDIVAANPDLHGPDDLRLGQPLVIPARAGGVTLEESSFVLELAYKLRIEPLGPFSRHRAVLPELDIPVMSATWHYYFPTAYEPLSFRSSFKQLTGVRYDPLRRIQYFIQDALRIRGAWAGEGKYSNILLSRKAIYHREQKKVVTEALSSFPLVGARHRFSRVLLGEDPAVIESVYVARSLLPWLRGAAFLLVLGFAYRALKAVERSSRWLFRREVWALAAVAGVVLLAGHYVLGVHRYALFGLDAALLAILSPRILAARPPLGSAQVIAEVLRRSIELRTIARAALACLVLAAALAYPLFISTGVTIFLFAMFLAGARDDEVAHA